MCASNINMKQLHIKTGITLLLSAGFLVVGNAQSGNVSIDQDKKITQLLEIYKSVNSNTNYYTVQIGFGSYAAAEDLKSQGRC